MDSVNLTILDIGHGNCSIIQSEGNITIIDAAQGADILDILSNKKVKLIDDIIISHTDADHIGGAIAILLDENIYVKRVHLNPDSDKNSKVWSDFRSALAFSRQTHHTEVLTSINRDTKNIVYKDFELEVLAPSPISCLTGPGTIAIEGYRLDANSMSVVIRLRHKGENIALIPGDMDAESLAYLKGEGQCLDAKILIFPHHGGLPRASNPHDFSAELCGLVKPDLIIFSNSRLKHDNPKIEIITGAKKSNCKTRFACTQMSKSCCEDDSLLSNTHLTTVFPSKGSSKKHSCAGSITIKIDGANTDVLAPLSDHFSYISHFSNRKCL
jgi:beta-lactamase superfamily II metal-dependent hydrolase